LRHATELAARQRPRPDAEIVGGEVSFFEPPSANAINATLYDNLRFSFIRDTTPVASIARIPLVLELHPSVPAKTVPEFIAYAKANPGKINMASSGNGTPLHVAGELFKMMAGVDMVHVPYRGEAVALPHLVSGQVQAIFGVVPASLGYIRAGKLRAMAVTSAQRQAVLPDVPAMSEFLPGYEASGWYGIVVPRATPAEIVEKLNKEINAGLAHRAFGSRHPFRNLDPAPHPKATVGRQDKDHKANSRAPMTSIKRILPAPTPAVPRASSMASSRSGGSM
jgi:tripartite-type tricarboxylate transporter receptor subunit TctC